MLQSVHMKIVELIRGKRSELDETLEQFGKRFGVTATAVSLWENGKREAPYSVIEFCISVIYVNCPHCKGTGYLEVKTDIK